MYQGGVSPTPPILTIDVFSDVVCPWCYLGKRRLTAALARLPGRPVMVRWRPFLLDATIPSGGIPRQEYLTRKFGSPEAVEPAHQRLVEAGRAEDIAYRFDLITRSPNTLDAHRVIRWGESDQRQGQVVERLFRGYFSEGRDVGDRAVLAELAADAGMTGDVAARLATDEDRAAVEAEIAEAIQLGINGVPCFVFNQRLAAIGAQGPDAILDAIRQADAMAA
jgi:predicted DsbA family dithiol-disulfide isomerase